MLISNRTCQQPSTLFPPDNSGRFQLLQQLARAVVARAQVSLQKTHANFLVLRYQPGSRHKQFLQV